MSQVDCPRCRNRIDDRATRCQYCHVDFTDEDLATMAKDKDAKVRQWLWIIGIGFLVLVVATSTARVGNQPVSTTSSGSAAPNSLKSEQEPPAPVQNWIYSKHRDEVRNGDVVEARATSSNSTVLDFPYGEIKLTMIVRQHPEWGLDVIFQADEGQILCRIRGCAGTINFDGRPERLTLNESGDNNSAIVFAAHPQAILRKLRQADRVIVELPFFQNGNRPFRFTTEGLEWPPDFTAPATAAETPYPDCDPALAASVGNTCPE